MSALHFGLSSVVVGVACLAVAFLAVDDERVATPLLAAGALAFCSGAMLSAIGLTDVLLFGLF